MLKSNKVNLLIAFVLAVALWAFVLEETKIVSTETLRNVPITFLNEITLENKGLVVMEKDVDTVNIVISGERSITSKVKAKDFKVIVDLENAVKGENRLPITINGVPEDVKIDQLSDRQVTVIMDEYKESMRKVKAVVNYKPKNGEYIEIKELGLSAVNVMGAASLVDSVKEVQAIAEGEDLKQGENLLEAKLIPVDKDGNQVQNVSFKDGKTEIKVMLNKTKEVPLIIPVEGLTTDGYERTFIVPNTVKIAGPENIIEQIQSIKTKKLDLSEVYEDAKIPLNANLPQGIKLLVNKGDFVADVSVDKVSNKSNGDNNGIIDEEDEPDKSDDEEENREG